MALKWRSNEHSDLEVSAIGLGCMSMSSGYGPPAELLAQVDAYWELSSSLAVDGSS